MHTLIAMLAVISEGYGLGISAHVGNVACVVCKHYELLYQLVFKHVVWCVYKLKMLGVCSTVVSMGDPANLGYGPT